MARTRSDSARTGNSSSKRVDHAGGVGVRRLVDPRLERLGVRGARRGHERRDVERRRRRTADVAARRGAARPRPRRRARGRRRTASCGRCATNCSASRSSPTQRHQRPVAWRVPGRPEHGAGAGVELGARRARPRPGARACRTRAPTASASHSTTLARAAPRAAPRPARARRRRCRRSRHRAPTRARARPSWSSRTPGTITASTNASMTVDAAGGEVAAERSRGTRRRSRRPPSRRPRPPWCSGARGARARPARSRRRGRRGTRGHDRGCVPPKSENTRAANDPKAANSADGLRRRSPRAATANSAGVTIAARAALRRLTRSGSVITPNDLPRRGRPRTDPPVAAAGRARGPRTSGR